MCDIKQDLEAKSLRNQLSLTSIAISVMSVMSGAFIIVLLAEIVLPSSGFRVSIAAIVGIVVNNVLRTGLRFWMGETV